MNKKYKGSKHNNQVTQHDAIPVDEPVDFEIATAEEPPVVEDTKEPVSSVKPKESQKLNNPKVFMTSGSEYEARNINLPATDTETTLKNLNSTINMNLKENKVTTQWAYTLSRGYNHNTIDGRFTNSLLKGSWGQGVESSTGTITGAKSIGKAITNQKLEGKDAVMRMLSHIGGNSNYNNVLWKSGIWFELDPISDSEILKLYRDLTKDTIELGRFTHGSVFSNTSVYTAERVIKFIFTKLGTHNYRGDKDLGDVLYLSDLPIFINSLISTIYPHGYDYNRSCAANPKSCHEVVSGKVDSSKAEWINREHLGDYNVKALAKGRKSVCNDATTTLYHDSLQCDNRRTVDIETISGAMINVTFKDPTFNEYITSGRLWLETIVDSFEEGLEEDKIEDRNNIISDMAKATALRQYAHFVESLSYGEGNITDDEDAINDILDILSGDTDFKTTFINEVNDFIDDTTIGIIGIPTYECAKCGGDQTEISEILPIDQLMLFFNLCTIRVQTIRQADI
jgi:hypothetical protein